MASYRFCRSDDVPLLVEAHNACYLPHFPELRPLTVEEFKRAAREIDLWTSSCMVAVEGEVPIAVLLACKRDDETLVWRTGVRPGHERRGHGRHLMTSLGSKLAILGPPRMVAELPAGLEGARGLLEACGWRREAGYTDFVMREPAPAEPPSDLVIPMTLDELIANRAFDDEARRCWARSPATLRKRGAAIRGLAVASDVRIEAWLLHEESEGERRLLALARPDASRGEIWLGLLVRQLAASAAGPLHFRRVLPEEVPFGLLRSWGFESAETTARYATRPRPG